jgi:uncharacterized protein
MKVFFEWDPVKAGVNKKKHKVVFETAASIFKDPNILTIPDLKHSNTEERWLSVGIAENGSILIIHHTFAQITEDTINIRIISARKANANEKKQYLEE